MIEISELRIGNWVLAYHPKKFRMVPAQVRGVHYYDLIELCDGEDFDIVAQSVYPIDVDCVVLECCGLKRKLERECFTLMDKSGFARKIAVEIEGKSNKLAVHENGKATVFMPDGVNSLHQLQNVYFAVFGEEIDIDADKLREVL